MMRNERTSIYQQKRFFNDAENLHLDEKNQEQKREAGENATKSVVEFRA